MIKIVLLVKGEEADKKTYFKIGDDTEKEIIFDNLVSLANFFLDLKCRDKDVTYEIEADQSMVLYKDTIDGVIKSILADNDLIELYKEQYISPREDNE